MAAGELWEFIPVCARGTNEIRYWREGVGFTGCSELDQALKRSSFHKQDRVYGEKKNKRVCNKSLNVLFTPCTSGTVHRPQIGSAFH